MPYRYLTDMLSEKLSDTPEHALLMPKIKAATVAAHRQAQRQLLLDQARKAISERGFDGLRFADLAPAVGLSRPTLYEYFDSREALVAALLHEELPRWLEQTRAQLAVASDPRAQVEVFLRSQLEMVLDRRHGVLSQLLAAAKPSARAGAQRHHQALFDMLRPPLIEMGIASHNVTLAIRLVSGVLTDANQGGTGWTPKKRAKAASLQFLMKGLDSLCDRSPEASSG